MKARQLSIAHASVYALGMIDQLRVIERGRDGLWGRWESTGTNARHIVRAGEVLGCIGLDGRVGALQRSPREPWVTWDLQASELTATRLEDGAPALFAGDAEGRVWHTIKPAPRADWTAWEPLGGPASGLVAERIPGGGLVIFGVRDGMVVHRRQERPAGPWQDWTPFDASIGEVVALDATPLAGGGLALFALTREGTLHHRWQEKPFERWHTWQELGGDLAAISATHSALGGLALFAIGTDGRVRARVQPRPFAPWGGWESLHASAKGIAAQPSWTDGLEVFAIGDDDEVRHAWSERLDWPWTAWRLLDHETAPVPLP